jgi:hypothetical protein
MNERKGLHVVLGIIGLAAWMFCILACRPSWSPDGSKILFPYVNPVTKEAGIAPSDRNTGAVKSIFVRPEPEKGWQSEFTPVAQWESGGSRAIVSWSEKRYRKTKKKNQGVPELSPESILHILVIPVGSEGKTRHFKLPDFESSLIPLPEVDGKLYLGGGGSFARLDLKTGRTHFRSLGDERDISFFNRDAGHIVYSRDGPESSDDWEIGDLDRNNLTPHPLFVLKKAEVAHYGVKEPVGFIAFERHGSRMAMTGKGQDEDKYFIMFLTDSGLQKVVAPELPAKVYQLGDLEWPSNGKTIYAMVVTPTEDEDLQFSLGEIPADGGPARLDPIVRVKTPSDHEI